METASELQKRLVIEMASKALMGSVLGYNVPIASAPILEDEVLEEIANQCPKRSFVACYVDLPEGRRWKILARKSGIHCGELSRLAMGGSGDRDHGCFLQKEKRPYLGVDCTSLFRIQVEYDV